MPDPRTIEELGAEMVLRKKDLLQRLELNEDTWSELQEKQVEFEEQAANVNLAHHFEGLDEQILRELFRLEKALGKIRNRTFGICESCGREISLERLKVLPEAEKCRRCAERQEPEGAASGVVQSEGGRKTLLPEELQGLDDSQLADRVAEYLADDDRIPTEELKIRFKNKVPHLSGYLPDETSRQILMQVLSDTLGLTDSEDHIVIDRLLWTRQDRRPGRREPGRTDYEQAAEGEGIAVKDPTHAQKSGKPLEPPDKLIPEKQGEKS